MDEFLKFQNLIIDGTADRLVNLSLRSLELKNAFKTYNSICMIVLWTVAI